MFDALSINGSDLPPDVVDLLTRIAEVQKTQCSMTFSAKELGTLGQAIGGMKRALTRSVRTAPSDEVANGLIELLTEATSLEKRIESTVHDALVGTLGPDYSTSAAAQKLNSLLDSQAAQLQEPNVSANSVVGLSDPAYL